MKLLLLSAGAAFGLTFFSYLSASGLVEGKASLVSAFMAAVIYAGLQFFIKLSAGLEKKGT